MKNKKTLFAFVLVIVVFIVLFFLLKNNKDYVEQKFIDFPATLSENSMAVPNSDLIATLVSDPDYIPSDTTGSPDLLLVLEHEDQSLYSKIRIPGASSIVYGADDEHVYVGGMKQTGQENVFIANIKTGKVENYSFGSKWGDSDNATDVSFSESARYMAYLDHEQNGKTVLYVHDFKTNKNQNIAFWPSGDGAVYQWQGNTLTYYRDTEQQFVNFEDGPMSAKDYLDIARVPTVKALEAMFTENGKILDYKIYDLVYYANRNYFKFKDVFKPEDSKDAFIVMVSFSVKTKDPNAWNGFQEPDGWFNDNSLFVKIDKNTEGYFASILGTSY